VARPPNVDSDRGVAHARDRFGLALGVGRSRLKGRSLRIGHLGARNELEVIGTLAGLELALKERGVDLALGPGVAACQSTFARLPVSSPAPAAV